MTKVHHGGDLDALMSSSETKIVDGIVRDRERMKVDLADPKVFARFDLLHSIAQRFSASAWFFIVDVEPFAYVGVQCFRGNVNGTIDGAEQHAQAACMIAVFVSDEHAVETLRVFADHREPARNFFCAQSGIDKHASVACNDQNCIAS